MMLIEDTAIATAALPVAGFKAHLRLGTGFAEDSVQDAVLEGFLRAALSAIEGRTGKVLMTRDFTMSLTGWRNAEGQVLPVAPVSAVTEVALVDEEGVETVLDTARYRLVPDTHAPVLKPVAAALPLVPTDGAVVVRFSAGFGATWDELPADLRQAVLLLAAHYYEYRDDTSLDGGCMPFGVTSLIQRYRNLRLFAGGAA